MAKALKKNRMKTWKPARTSKDQEEEIEWKRERTLFGGKRKVNTKGWVKVVIYSITPGSDGLRYTVEWHPLDKDGKRMTVVQNQNRDIPEHGGLFLGTLEQIFKPPYDHPHGFEVTVRIPPQPPYNANSYGPYLNIFTSVGGGKKES